jgi:hypothetical protein
MRALVAAGLLGMCLAGCGQGGGTGEDRPAANLTAADLTAAERAAAECGAAVREGLVLAESEPFSTRDVAVEKEGEAHRVTGRWEVTDAGYGTFDCVVVPDETDELRGLRVTELEVRRARDPA